MKQFKHKPKPKDYMDNTYNKEESTPINSEGSVKTMISEKALRNLPHSSYSVQADPYTSSLPGSQPYPIIARFNKKIGGYYKGLKNIDGGNVQQYANSVNSQMLKYTDFIKAVLPVNYRMLPMNDVASGAKGKDSYVGKQLIDEQRKAIAEATSVLASTTFTQMAIYNYGIVTDMPMGSATTTNMTVDGEKNIPVYTNISDVIYGALTYYQNVLQAGLNVFNWHNSMRLKMGTMIRRSWNRETPFLNALFGLFKKKSFLSFLESIALSFEGEYIDIDEMKQINMLTLTPSARSEALTDPVLELGVKFNRPNSFKLVYIAGEAATTVFSQEDMTVPVKTSATEKANMNYFDIIDDLIDAMSAATIMAKARGDVLPSSDTAYYNDVKWRIDGLAAGLTKFKTLMNDIREVLDTMTRTGTVTWRKGFRPNITKDTDAPMFDNLIINDIYKIMASSADEVDFDEATKRWRTFSLWNMYNGIPEYDAYQGGAFLTLSLKNLNYSNDSDKVYEYLPIRFTINDGYTKDGEKLKDYRQFTMVARDGQVINVSGTTTVQMSTDTTLARLVPLTSQLDLVIRVPNVVTPSLSTGHKSCAYKTLTQVFGLCQVPLVNNTDVSLDPDIIAVYQIELEDITNEAITYARSHAPFRGTVSTVDILGFSNYDLSSKS